jgi:serine/threonine protein kinase
VSLPLGSRIGRYEIRSLLGAGGMGEVYRAHDEKLGREVAIKVLPAAFAADPERLARFEREARTLAALNHPNIAQIGLEKPHVLFELPKLSTDVSVAGTRSPYAVTEDGQRFLMLVAVDEPVPPSLVVGVNWQTAR